MCLSTLDVAVHWDEELKLYVGYGYKALWKADFKQFDQWITATGDYEYKNRNLNRSFGYPTYGSRYHTGFHIFLNENDAANYAGLYNVSNGRYVSTYEVVYHTILAFGQNNTNSGSGPCVIAKHMYVHSERLRNNKGELRQDLKGPQ